MAPTHVSARVAAVARLPDSMFTNQVTKVYYRVIRHNLSSPTGQIFSHRHPGYQDELCCCRASRASDRSPQFHFKRENQPMVRTVADRQQLGNRQGRSRLVSREQPAQADRRSIQAPWPSAAASGANQAVAISLTGHL